MFLEKFSTLETSAIAYFQRNAKISTKNQPNYSMK